MTRLAPGLPKGDGNGLDQLSRKLIDEPHRVRVVIALIDTKKLATDVDTGDVEPTARIRRVEAVLPEDYRVAEAAREGRAALQAQQHRDPRGLRADLTPTVLFGDESHVYRQLTDYLRRLDRNVRERAAAAVARGEGAKSDD